MQENSRTACDRLKIHKLTPQQRQAQLVEPVEVVQTSAGGPTRQHLELGQDHRARLDYQSEQRVTSREVRLRKHSDFEGIFLS